MSIKLKLIGFALLISVVLATAMSVYFIQSGHNRTLQAFTDEADDITSILAETIVNDLYYLDGHALRLKLRSAHVSPNILYTYATDSEFRIVSDGSDANAKRTQPLQAAIFGPNNTLEQPYTWVDNDVFRVRTPVLLLDNTNIGYLFVGFSFEQANKTIHDITFGGLKIAGGCIFLGMLIAVLLAQRISRRIHRLSAGAAAIGAGDLDTVVPDHGSDELADLASSVNRMAANLKNSTVSKEYVSNILDSMIDLVIVASPQGLIEYINPAAQAHLGRQDSLFGKHISEFIADADIARDILDRHRTPKYDTGLIQTELLTMQGGRLAVNMSVSVIKNHAGRPDGILLTAQDATELNAARQALHQQIEERTAVERQLRQAKKMESIGQLTGGIAHDFNNILGTILGHGELAQMEAKKLVSPRIQEYLDEIQLAGNRAKDLVAQMLTFSRGGSSTPEVVFVKDTLDKISRLLRSTLPSSIVLSSDQETPVRPILIDPVQLEQIIMNLCINARDAIGAVIGGQINIRVQRVRIATVICASCQQRFKGEYIQLSVTDSGVGIDVSNLNKIFEPFFTTKEVGKGTGMGLSTTHGLVHEHHGHILIDTSVGKGTRFNILFPPSNQRPTAQPVPAINPPATPAALPAGHILIVDDEPALGRFLVRFFEGHGLSAEAETDPREALKRVQDEPHRFDLIITDMTMPHMSGLDFSHHVHQTLPDLPVILCTGYSKDDIATKVKSAGISLIMAKPIKTELLLEQTGKLLAARLANNHSAS